MGPEVLGILAELNQRLLEDEASQAGVLRHVTDTALRLLAADHASVRLCAPGGLLESGARSGVGSELPLVPFQRGEGILGWVAETGKPARVADSRLEPRFADRRERGFAVGSVLSVPVLGAGKTLGVLSLSSARPGAFDETHEALATLLAGTAAHALRAAELRQLCLTDSQTLAYNRRYLGPRLCEEMQRANRNDEPLSVLLMDLDHFKRVNDGHGHAVGDAVLRAFADAVRGCVRSIDVMVRRGGEEFVLILPGTGEAEASGVAERLREQLEQEPLYVRHGLAIRQTVSIGVATWDGVQSAESLEERADHAMYEAKQRGRNQVVAASASAPVVLANAPDMR